MNTETSPEVAIEPNTRAETERLEREQKRKEREGEAAVINAVVDKINALIDRMNALSSERIDVRHAYGEASIRMDLDRTEANAAELRTVNNRLHEIDREHFNVSRDLAILESEYTKLAKAYDDKWTPASLWEGFGAAAGITAALSSLVGSYFRSDADKKAP